MLYTEDFSMHHYVGFSQIGSHLFVVLLPMLLSFYVFMFCRLKGVVDLFLRRKNEEKDNRIKKKQICKLSATQQSYNNETDHMAIEVCWYVIILTIIRWCSDTIKSVGVCSDVP